MFDRQTWVIIWLSLNLMAIQFYWLKAEKKVSYFEGRESVFNEMSMKEDGKDVAFDCGRTKCK